MVRVFIPPYCQTNRVPYLSGLNTRRGLMIGAIGGLGYPTPTPTLPPAFAEAASRRQAEGEGNRHALRIIPPPSETVLQSRAKGKRQSGSKALECGSFR
jgi:hypothetical protein